MTDLIDPAAVALAALAALLDRVEQLPDVIGIAHAAAGSGDRPTLILERPHRGCRA
jgi:hypothetical protein